MWELIKRHFLSNDVYKKQILADNLKKKKYDATNCIQLEDKF